MLTLRRKFSDPVFLLALVAALGAFVVQSGELGSSDTTHRLQVAHSFWTPEPPVFPHAERIARVASIALTFCFVSLGWVFFVLPTGMIFKR